MPIKLRYRGHLYQIEDGGWRGRDGNVVHLLTWITDELLRQREIAPGPHRDLDAARKVAGRLGSEARVLDFSR